MPAATRVESPRWGAGGVWRMPLILSTMRCRRPCRPRACVTRWLGTNDGVTWCGARARCQSWPRCCGGQCRKVVAQPQRRTRLWRLWVHWAALRAAPAPWCKSWLGLVHPSWRWKHCRPAYLRWSWPRCGSWRRWPRMRCRGAPRCPAAPSRRCWRVCGPKMWGAFAFRAAALSVLARSHAHMGTHSLTRARQRGPCRCARRGALVVPRDHPRIAHAMWRTGGTGCRGGCAGGTRSTSAGRQRRAGRSRACAGGAGLRGVRVVAGAASPARGGAAAAGSAAVCRGAARRAALSPLCVGRVRRRCTVRAGAPLPASPPAAHLPPPCTHSLAGHRFCTA